MSDTLDRPLAMSRGSGAALAPRITPRICTSRKIKTLEAYPILLRTQGLHPVGALVHTPRRGTTPKASRVPGDNLAENPAQTNSTHNQHAASEGVYLLLHRLGGYTRRVRSHAPPEKSNPKNKPRPRQQLGQSPAKSITNVQPLKDYTYSSTSLGATVGYHN
jgi:hypothetical protein